MASMHGKVAVVTGASRGIGKGCALELGEAGATVYVTGRTVQAGQGASSGSLSETVDEIEAGGGRAIAVACDHNQDEQVSALFQRIRKDER